VVFCSKHRRRHCVKVPAGARRQHAKQDAASGPKIKLASNLDGLGAGPGQREQGALAWARTLMGSQAYDGWCARFVAYAYGAGAYGYNTAWQGAQAWRMNGQGQSAANAPAGTLVFFKPTGAVPSGHVGLSLGDGRMISAESNGVKIDSITGVAYWRGLYAGWQYAPASWPGRIPPPPANSAPAATPPTSVGMTAPAAGQTVSGTVSLSATAANATGVEFDAYYATDPSNVATVGWHALGRATTASNGTYTYNWNSASIPDQGNAGWGTVNIAAIALDANGNGSAVRDYHRVTVDNASATSTAPAPSPAPAPGGTPPDRSAVTSYDRMQPGAPNNGVFANAWQPFTARTNTITHIGVTVGKSGYGGGLTVNVRLCANQPDGSGNCSVLGQASPPVVNFGDSEGDIGDVGVTPGQTYWVSYFPPQPYGNGWLTYWWSGGSTASSSDQMQVVVRGYNR
jgi:hypothetical protein